jgi:hypothetical protein
MRGTQEEVTREESPRPASLLAVETIVERERRGPAGQLPASENRTTLSQVDQVRPSVGVELAVRACTTAVTSPARSPSTQAPRVAAARSRGRSMPALDRAGLRCSTRSTRRLRSVQDCRRQGRGRAAPSGQGAARTAAVATVTQSAKARSSQEQSESTPAPQPATTADLLNRAQSSSIRTRVELLHP